MVERKCWFCGCTDGLQLHHVYHGTANRKNSDKAGLTVYLCYEHHQGTNGVHGKNGRVYDLTLKRQFQQRYEETHTRAEFMSLIGKNYLD